MADNKDPTHKFEALREQAEELVRNQTDVAPEKPLDILELIHELRIHQAELEIQNEELQRAQQEISKLHKEYQDLYEFAPSGYLTLNNKGIITRLNLSGSRLLGIERDYLPRVAFSQFIDPGWENAYLSARKECIKTGQKQSIELPIKRKKGPPLWVQAEIQADLNDADEVLQWRVVLSDISEKKKTEIALSQSERRFRELFEKAPLSYQSLDNHGNFIAVNQTWLDTMGYHEAEVIGRNFSEFIHPDWKGHFKKNFPKFKAVGEVLGTEFILLKKDGTEMLVSYHGKIGTNAMGEFKQTHCVFYDITDQKRFERKLKESELKYRNLFKSSSDAIFLVDVKTLEILDANDKAISQYGYKYDELLKMKAPDLSAEPEETKAVIKKAQDMVIPVRYHRRKDETVFPVEITSSVFTLKNREINLSTIRDVSKIKKIEMQLQQAQKMESIGTLAGGIAHDFNNILSSIIGFTELSLDNAERGSDMEDNLQEIYTAGIRAKELVKQILTFARQSDDEIKLTKIDSIAEEVLHFIRSTIPSNIEIKKELNSKSLVMGNEVQIHQCLMNLFTNAAQAMANHGGTLEISLADITVDNKSEMPKIGLKPIDYIELRIADSGPGIPAKHLNFIFEPYYTTKGPGEGTGMGLAVVNGIVESYGGKVFVKSKLGKGTVFTIYLPITKKRDQKIAYEPVELPGGDERILFVDDEISIVKMGGQILQRLGYSVTTRTSSIEALELFRAKPFDFDLIITDMTMPKITGDELAKEMIDIRSTIPVILCTGYNKRIKTETVLEIGIKAFAYKPIVKADLAKTVRKVLDEAKG